MNSPRMGKQNLKTTLKPWTLNKQHPWGMESLGLVWILAGLWLSWTTSGSGSCKKNENGFRFQFQFWKSDLVLVEFWFFGSEFSFVPRIRFGFTRPSFGSGSRTRSKIRPGLVPIWLELVRTGGSNCRNQVTAQHRVRGKLSRQPKRGRKRKRGRRKEKGGKGNTQNDSLGSLVRILCPAQPWFAQLPATAAGISSLTCFACSLARSLAPSSWCEEEP